MEIYADPIIEKYEELIKANTPVFKRFYQGEPIRIASVDLPCAIISKRETQVQPLSNAQDQHAIGLSITVITDVRKDLSSEESMGDIVAGVSSLYDIAEGRNADYTLKATSILDILRSNITVDAAQNLRTDLGSVTRVDYGATLRSRSPEMWTIEARIDFVVSFSQTR